MVPVEAARLAAKGRRGPDAASHDAYSSAYAKFHYLAACACALLNNQPMGFYSPSTIINDAKRHGLKVLPIDVQHADWRCMLKRTEPS